MLNVGVLASGRGSNFQAIIDAVEGGDLRVALKLLVSDKPGAYALERARKHSIEALVLQPKEFGSRDLYFEHIAREMSKREIGLVVLAGFMRIVGKPLIAAFPNRIMNIHPALLPSFPGLHGHRDALDYGVKISGCTVHFVDEGMDTGPVIIQAAVPVFEDDDEDALSARILPYEHKIYPEAIRLFAEGRLSVEGRKVRVHRAAKAEDGIVSPAAGA